MAALNGKWKLVSLDNFEPYLDAVGVQGETREQALKLLTPQNNIVQDINIDGDNIKIITITPVSPIEVAAQNGVEFNSRYLDGREIKTMLTKEGDTLIEKISGSFSSTIVRAIEGDQMVMTMTCGDVTSTRRYERV